MSSQRVTLVRAKRLQRNRQQDSRNRMSDRPCTWFCTTSSFHATKCTQLYVPSAMVRCKVASIQHGIAHAFVRVTHVNLSPYTVFESLEKCWNSVNQNPLFLRVLCPLASLSTPPDLFPQNYRGLQMQCHAYALPSSIVASISFHHCLELNAYLLSRSVVDVCLSIFDHLFTSFEQIIKVIRRI